MLRRGLCPGGDCAGKTWTGGDADEKIIFDCDNTFGVKDCDVDDGLALMYLLGSREAQLLGITSTYGNSSLDVVQAVNLRMLEELGRRDIPVKEAGRRGAVTRARLPSFWRKWRTAIRGNCRFLPRVL